MFSKRQKALRCMLYHTHDHYVIPEVIPREKLKQAHRFLCENYESQDFQRFEKIMNGEIEPTDEEVSRKLAVYEWYVPPWYMGAND